jgi:hypothetical protein
MTAEPAPRPAAAGGALSAACDWPPSGLWTPSCGRDGPCWSQDRRRSSGLPGRPGPPRSCERAPSSWSFRSLMPIATAISPVTQLHASGVSGVRCENDDAVSRIAVLASMPSATCSFSVSARPASAAAISRFFSLGASGSRSLSRFDIVRGLERAATPCSGSVTMAFSAARASAACSQLMSAIRLPSRSLTADRRAHGAQAMPMI